MRKEVQGREKGENGRVTLKKLCAAGWVKGDEGRGEGVEELGRRKRMCVVGQRALWWGKLCWCWHVSGVGVVLAAVRVKITRRRGYKTRLV